MSDNKLWAIFWTSLASVVIVIAIAITYCSVTETNQLYKAQTVCIEKNATWAERTVKDSLDKTRSCTFTR